MILKLALKISKKKKRNLLLKNSFGIDYSLLNTPILLVAVLEFKFNLQICKIFKNFKFSKLSRFYQYVQCENQESSKMH